MFISLLFTPHAGQSIQSAAEEVVTHARLHGEAPSRCYLLFNCILVGVTTASTVESVRNDYFTKLRSGAPTDTSL